MKKIDLKELQKIEFDILCEFDEFCQKHGLKYSLAFGSLIGAARHKGFIPWDDDIDVYMMREEYEKFVELIEKGEKFQKNYIDVLLPGDGRSFYPIIKLIDSRTLLFEKNVSKKNKLGVWLDVFPIDYVCDDYKEACDIEKKYMKYAHDYMVYFMRYEEKSLKSFLKNLYVVGANFLTKYRCRNLRRKLMEYNGVDKKKYCGNVIWSTSIKNIYKSEWLQEYSWILFEGKKFMCFSRYQELLKYRYGDYMSLPPEDQRVSHDPEAYWL